MLDIWIGVFCKMPGAENLFNLVKHKRRNVENKLIWFVSLFVVAIFISMMMIYYKIMLSVYSEQLVKSNESVLDQIVIAFESVTKQTMNSVYNIPLYDNEIRTLMREYGGEVSDKMDIIRKLNSIVLGNEYMSTACLYITRDDIIFDADSGNSSSLENFFDKSALQDVEEGGIRIIDPRIMEIHMQKKLLLTVVCPLPIPVSDNGYEGFFIVYIDIQKMYNNILKKINVRGNMDFYVYNADNVIVLHKDEGKLNKKFDTGSLRAGIDTNISIPGERFARKTSISSRRYSNQLKWNFFLKTDFDSPLNQVLRLYSFAVYFLIIILVSLPLVIFIVKYSVRPIKKAITSYNDKLWKDFITNGYVDTEEMKKLFAYENYDYTNQHCAVMVFQIYKLDSREKGIKEHITESIQRYFASVSSISGTKIIITGKDSMAVVLYFRKDNSIQSSEAKLTGIAGKLYESLNPDFKKTTCLAVSLPKDSLSLLSMAYMECMEILKYRIYAASNLLRYSDIMDKKNWQEYPYETERQLINNIVIGNPETCRSLAEKFLESLAGTACRIQDSEFKSCVYQLQAAIMKNVTNLQLSNTIDYYTVEIMELYEFDAIKQKLLEMIEKILQEINKKDKDDEYLLYGKISGYVEANYKREDFNMNKAADELKLNRNYLAKLVKMHASENFNDYVNSKRIMEAKRLLTGSDRSIEEITHCVGFNYSHYFIKVFKSIEGITPGKYREKFQGEKI